MLCLLATLALAAPNQTTRCEVAISATAAPADPDLVAVSVEFSQDANKYVVNGFWDGRTTWKARARLSPGPWQYRATSKPSVPGLDGATGTINAPDAPRNDFDKKGPLKIAASGTHFTYGDGTPFFWLGDTAWAGMHYSTPGDWDFYLTTRRKQRFTVIQTVIVAPWRLSPTDAESRVAFHRRERLEIDPEFFRRVDERMDAINKHNLLAAAVMLWAIEGAENPGWTFTDEQATFLAKYVFNRYGAHDVAWILAGDGKYDSPASVARWSKIANAVFGSQPTVPATLHPQGMHWPFEKYRNVPAISFYGYQSGHGDDDAALAFIHSGAPAKNWANKPARPILNLELPYEGHLTYHSKTPIQDVHLRRAVWWSLLSTPIAGLTYGSQGVWSWQMSPGTPRAHPEAGFAPAWHQALDRSGAKQMKLMRDLLDTLPWTELRPAQDLLATQPGAGIPERFTSVAKTEKGDVILAYVPQGRAIKFRPDAIPAGATACWYDPRSGNTSPSMPAAAEMETPDVKDWVLVIRKGG